MKPTPNPHCRLCGLLICSCEDTLPVITDEQAKRIKVNLESARRNLIKREVQRRLPDLSQFPLKDYSS